MIGSGLKKLAKENGMTVAQGVAYGNFRGYAATFCEGSGWKAAAFATMIADPGRAAALDAAVEGHDMMKEFRVRQLQRSDNRIEVVFHDTMGTMKKMEAFFDWFIPLLDEAQATKCGICTECGTPTNTWKLINGVAYPIHDACAQRLFANAEAALEKAEQEDTGTYAMGTLGALVGALVGALPWAVVYVLGYVAALLGILIGWCSKKGYELMRGKEGKPKIAIVLAASLLGACFGCFLGDVLGVVVMILQGELYGATLADIPMLFGMLFEDAGYVEALTSNLLQSSFFAALGLITTFSQMKRESDAGKVKIKDLN